MRRWIAFLLLCSLLLTSCALAEEAQEAGVQVTGEKAGEVFCPEGADAQSAQYVYHGTVEGSFINENYSKINMNHFERGRSFAEALALSLIHI